MNEIARTTGAFAVDRPIGVAVLAMGGQGGGVLTDWIVALAENQGWHAQSTSVPGVAQRTGATIYYIEMMKAKDGKEPILSLMPSPGDVDVVVAAEWMEAGRSVLRGLVTPDKTVLIASTHRSYAVGEKEKPGDGVGDPMAVTDAAGVAAKSTIAFDMQSIADQNGSVISAALFGALAGSQVLPFPAEAFAAVIRSGGKGIEPSLKTFEAARIRATQGGIAPVAKAPAKKLDALPTSVGHPKLDRLLARIRSEFPAPAQSLLYAGIKRLVDFQDVAYADEYLNRVARVLASDREHGGELHTYALTQAAAKYVAVAMAYDDIIRVADLKTRGTRFDRIKKQMDMEDDQILYMTEFMHPRAEEIVSTLPRGLALWIERNKTLFDGIDRIVNRARRVRTGTIRAFLTLYIIGGMRGWRRGTLRHAREREHLQHWLDAAMGQVTTNYELAVEVLNARRLVKGYSDTHARGLSKFDRVMDAIPALANRPDAASWMRRLIAAALQDENGTALDGAVKTIASL
ncbi:MAG TPA: indolepyruvate oxidoreductase subunit beta family protein [Magnetospirillaceae bacterium]|jgi:indolepyruvate ferredoxin oxidoreductase beta subunit